MSYWDTSALVKLYAQEPDSAAFEAHAASQTNPLITSRIALYEARATFRRKEAEGILERFQKLCSGFAVPDPFRAMFLNRCIATCFMEML
jgi:uncharacterized protein with PIN domain